MMARPSSHPRCGEIHPRKEDRKVKGSARVLSAAAASMCILCCLCSCASIGISGRNSLPDVGGFENAISSVADSAIPCVVHIDVSGAALERSPSRPPMRALGSGILISEEGYIITNNHVVQNAQTITVHFFDGTERIAAVVGTDRITDIAVIKVEGTGKGLAAKFGDSDRLKVGEWVVAIGSPRGLDWTVTAGIVSATHRANMGARAAAGLEDFIQTDSAINPGNSGGPLLNLRGQVVGMNSLIVSQGQGSEGLGFAIPSNLMKEIADTLRKEGKISRGDLGIAAQDISESMRRAFNLPLDTLGIAVTEAIPLGPAAGAGVVQGDVIVSLQGNSVSSVADFNRATARMRPGTEVALGLLRGQVRRTVSLAVVDQLALMEKQAARPGYAFLGVRVKAVSEDLAKTVGLSDPVGVVVVEVVPGSPADNVGIAPGDIVFQVGGSDVNDEEQFRTRIGEAIRADNVIVLLRDGQSGRTGYMEVPLR
ncbi:MAG: trypsin-like peptidase domain-containing protein [Spirochaetia bacterium]